MKSSTRASGSTDGAVLAQPARPRQLSPAARQALPRSMHHRRSPWRQAEAQAALRPAVEEIDVLLKRGQDLVATGDISGGRLLLTRAAEAGDARAAVALGSTYDSAVVATLGVVGAFPDPAKARAWYARAAEQGSTEAARRLEQPHLRQR